MITFLNCLKCFKGALFVINNTPKNSFLTKGDWQALLLVLPALVFLKPAEKSSITKELKYISSVLKGYHHTINFELNLTEACLSAASDLWNTSGAPSTVPHPSENEIIKGISAQESLNESNLKAYTDIFERLITAVVEADLNWRHRQLAMEFMCALIHPNYPLPVSVVTYFLQALIDDSLEQRKLGYAVIMQCLRQHKRINRKVFIVCALNIDFLFDT